MQIFNPQIFQIVSQLKIFATAIFSILLLDRRLARVQWVSLGVLSAGVILVQLQQGSSKAGKGDENMNPVIGKDFFERILAFN